MQKSENTPLSHLASGNGAGASTQASKLEPSRKRGATGPRTTQGKERSKRNALKHGIFCQVGLLKDESPAEYAALLNGLRENLQPEGTLEEILVEKLALNTWRQRRLIIAETAEIRRATEFLAWDADQQQTECTNKVSDYSIRFEGGLIQRIANSEVLERCLELLKELREGINKHGFDLKSDSEILKKLYGEPSSEKWQQTLFDSYVTWLGTAQCTDEERQQHGYATPQECQGYFLEEINGELKRLNRYKTARASVESEKMKLEALRRHVPLTPQFDHLHRYEASLERNFDRTLNQLERLQRMRKGQPVSLPLNVNVSAS